MSSNTNTDSSSMFGEKKAREKATFCRHGSHKHSKPEKMPSMSMPPPNRLPTPR